MDTTLGGLAEGREEPMIFDGKLVVKVESGTVITDPESGERFRVDDRQGVVQRNLLYVTADRFKMLADGAAEASSSE